MKSQEPTYKKFPFPLRILLSYILLSVTGMILLDILSTFLIVTDSVNGFLDVFLSTGLVLVAYAVEMFVFAIILCGICGRKIYRGIGLYRFATIVSVACPIAFVGMIVFMNATNMTYIFFNIVTLFFELAVPPVLMCFLRLFTRRCKGCGLINTYKYLQAKIDNLGQKHKYHSKTVWIGEHDNVNYFADMQVYDGLFEKKRTTTHYRCAICGKIIKETTTTETKIGG